ncbi:uncharacterized protein LOC143257158 [Tachypleus tridentatus]|uniref:uncharacterized protein LOC143257158 n=1 Tax=Tachypleus tridentatus TaxID=6853 RepID=UPI003FCF1988
MFGMRHMNLPWYLGAVLPLDDCNTQAIECHVFAFLWGSKPEAVSRLSLTLPPRNGHTMCLNPVSFSLAVYNLLLSVIAGSSLLPPHKFRGWHLSQTLWCSVEAVNINVF